LLTNLCALPYNRAETSPASQMAGRSETAFPLRQIPTERKGSEASSMKFESEETELSRLRQEQAKTRHDEVFGGLSPAERAAYHKKQDRIFELECRLSGQDWRQSKFGSLA
jgi:hypothetical protein